MVKIIPLTEINQSIKNFMSINQFIFTIIISFVSIQAHCQALKIKPIDSTMISKNIEYEGQLKSAFTWLDANGKHILITTETGIHENEKFTHENEGRDAMLFAYHYLVAADSNFLQWRVYDYITDCPVDIEASFIKNTTKVTDLDKDGIAEIWLMYKTACRGDVSPCDMKIIMYEGKQKYALRGQSKVMSEIDERGNKKYIGGEYKTDKIFNSSPSSFMKFAKEMWSANNIEKWEE
jgi:hypothetical protein